MVLGSIASHERKCPTENRPPALFLLYLEEDLAVLGDAYTRIVVKVT